MNYSLSKLLYVLGFDLFSYGLRIFGDYVFFCNFVECSRVFQEGSQ